jgi:Ras-related protein Rab-21
VGDTGRVGKTSLVLRYVQNSFNDSQPATIQASYLTKRLTVENKTINLAIWVRGGPLPLHVPTVRPYAHVDACLRTPTFRRLLLT